ncbi:MAG: MerR family transcriptional regulator [Bradyrhizobium sp.]|uniref:MerR family transcriptional regulator n=1 Tax=Bradyrhizobium sp. TaxID=376 RepID=UPI001E131F74|nr:MerR family transcriptional regulator [Bradyrhizobium sp.]MBV9565810.1 MerR family transcriptional regulator [Bradyrhizobium sp.]
MDKAPDAFRTISEVASDLDIPQHVLRFWETRFSQIKPMKRSGGRRYYRPDDVDLLKGIRRLLYGEGYTIRGVQRILKEHGIKSVQSLADNSAAVSFGAIEEALGQSLLEDNNDTGVTLNGDDEEEEEDNEGASSEDGIDFRFVDAEDDILETFRHGTTHGATHAATHGRSAEQRTLDRERLEGALKDLIDCRQMLERAMKDG